MPFVSRAGPKLEHAIVTLHLTISGVCADLGCSTGGFTDCLLQHGAAKVYAVDTGYGVLDWKLRKDPRVVVMERTNAMHIELPEKVDWVSIDVAWTKQKHILPATRRILKPGGAVLSLIKPHYEANPSLLRGGILLDEAIDGVVKDVAGQIEEAGFRIENTVLSPIRGAKGNAELVALLRPITS